MMNKALLTFLFMAALTSSGRAHESDLTGIIKRTEKENSPYKLELDGGTGCFYLRGEDLEQVPDGTQIWVTGEIKTELSELGKTSSNHWQIYLDVEKYRVIDKPFSRLEPIKVTVNGDYKNTSEFLRTIAEQTGWSIVVTSEVSSTHMPVSLRFDEIDAEEVLNSVLKLQGLTYRMVGDTVVVELANEKEPNSKQQ